MKVSALIEPLSLQTVVGSCGFKTAPFRSACVCGTTQSRGYRELRWKARLGCDCCGMPQRHGECDNTPHCESDNFSCSNLLHYWDDVVNRFGRCTIEVNITEVCPSRRFPTQHSSINARIMSLDDLRASSAPAK
jgi:hypothetical protein